MDVAPLWRRYFGSDEEARVAGQIVDGFHRIYYAIGERGGTWRDTYWHGVRVRKCPLDLWVYQELLHELRPDLIVETGTAYGGSALYLAHMCDLLGQGEVVTVDAAQHPDRPKHGRIEYVHGYSTDPAIVGHVAARVCGKESVLVLLDSDHSAPHVLEELRLYSRFATVGSYCVVEDSNVNGHPLIDQHGPGPWEAIQQFLEETKDFVIDREREKFLLTFSPWGYLRRVA